MSVEKLSFINFLIYLQNLNVNSSIIGNKTNTKNANTISLVYNEI